MMIFFHKKVILIRLCQGMWNETLRFLENLGFKGNCGGLLARKLNRNPNYGYV